MSAIVTPFGSFTKTVFETSIMVFEEIIKLRIESQFHIGSRYLNLVFLCLLKQCWSPLLHYNQRIELYVWYIQTTVQGIILLYFHGCLCIMKETVQHYQMRFRNTKTNDLIKGYIELLRIQSRFWREYLSLMIIQIVQYFYDVSQVSSLRNP